MCALRMSKLLAFVVGLCVFVLITDSIQCSEHRSNKHKTGPGDELNHVDGPSRSHRLRSHGSQKSHENHAKRVSDERGEDDFRSSKRLAKLVPYRNSSMLRAFKSSKITDLKNYEVADKKEFERILDQSKRIKIEREEKDKHNLVGGKKESDNRKKDNEKNCDGYTCNFQNECGLAPLNALSSRAKSYHQTGLRSKKKQIDSYMINGTRQIYGEWPSYVRIETTWGLAYAICGGTIISDRHILTAAHCMYDPDKGEQRVKVHNIRVILGEDRIGQRDNNERILGVEDVCVSKRFEEDVPGGDKRSASKEKTGTVRAKKVTARNQKSAEHEEGVAKYDYAVLTLKEKIKFTDHHQPSCLPGGKLAFKSTEYDKDPYCYLVGSGVIAMGEGGPNKMAKTVEKMRMRRVSCEAYGFGRRDESRECYTKADSAGDSCAGDSGGPILCLNDKTKRWSVVSLVSYGSSECNGEGAIGWVGVYTRVTNLLPIIKNECGI